MDLDLDPFENIVAERTARAGGKFQPKARPQPQKGKHVPATKAKDTPASETTVPENSLHTVSVTQMTEVMPSTAAPCESSPLNQEKVNITKFFDPGYALPNEYNSFAPVDISSQSLNALRSELSISSIAGDLQSDFATSERESADILFNINDIIPESTTATENKLSDSCDGVAGAEDFSENAEIPLLHKAKDKLDRGLGLQPCSLTLADTSPKLVSEEKLNATETGVLDQGEEFVVDSESLGGKEQVFPGLDLNDIPQTTTTGVVQSVTETEYTDDYAYPAPYVDDYVDPGYYSDDFVDPVSADNASVNHSTVDVPRSAMPNHASECLRNHDDASRSNSVIPQVVVESEVISPISGKKKTRRKKVGFALDDKTKNIDYEKAEEISQEAPREGNLLETNEKNESGKSTRLLRKRPNASVLRDKTKGGTKKVANLSTGPSIRSLEDEDGYSDGGDKNYEDTSHSKRKAKKAKPAVQAEKPSRKRKKTSEGQDSSKEPPKKKFSHTTRKNKRRASRETPEEEIDPRELRLKDLIRRAESKEKSVKKDSAVSKQSLPTQSVDNSFHMDAPFDAPSDASDPFASVGVDRDFQEVERQKINYHSFMKTTARIKWPKQDTELFYEGIRQFGTNFAMIQLLFPDLDPDDGRHQLVLKYKNEERRNPLRLHEALTNRSKNHSLLERVIEKFRKLDEDLNFDIDVESGGTGEEAEDNAPDTNNLAESHQKDISDDTDTTEIPEADDPAQGAHEAEDDDGYNYDDYNDYSYDEDYVV